MADVIGDISPKDPVLPETPLTPELGDAAPPTGWRSKLSEDVAKGVSKFKTDEELAKGYVELEKFKGASVRIPASDAKPEDVEAYVGKLRPASEDGYELAYPDHGGQVEWNDAGKAFLKKAAHAVGLHPYQAQKFAELYSDWLYEQGAADDKITETEVAKLRQDYGASYDRSVALANRALEHLGGTELLDLVKESGLGSNAIFARAMFKLGLQFADDETIPGDVEGVLGPADAKSKIAAIRRDTTHPYNDVNHPQHKSAVADVEKLYALAYAADSV